MPVIHIGKPSEAALDRLHRFFHELILEILSGKRKCKILAHKLGLCRVPS